MEKAIFLFPFLLLTSFYVNSQDIIELDPLQSMSITGKGPGQDAAINPFVNTKSTVIVENIGENDFSIRIQIEKEVIKEITIKPEETKEINLKKEYQVYFDSKRKTKAKVSFTKQE